MKRHDIVWIFANSLLPLERPSISQIQLSTPKPSCQLVMVTSPCSPYLQTATSLVGVLFGWTWKNRRQRDASPSGSCQIKYSRARNTGRSLNSLRIVKNVAPCYPLPLWVCLGIENGLRICYSEVLTIWVLQSQRYTLAQLLSTEVNILHGTKYLTQPITSGSSHSDRIM